MERQIKKVAKTNKKGLATLNDNQAALVKAVEDNRQSMKKDLVQINQALQKITKSHASSEAAIRRERQERLMAEETLGHSRMKWVSSPRPASSSMPG